uniref:Uncharacterized protein n=1 Tax=Romanomermis culicivorax TaxID=13658 RepID=A0A915HLR9_ROMCU
MTKIEISYLSPRRDKLVDESYVLRFNDEILNAKYAMFFKVSPMAQLFCLAPTSRWHEALEIFNNSPSLKKNAHCYFMVSACLIEQNRFREAFELFNNFLDFDLVVPEKSHHTVSFHESALNFILKLSSDVRKKSAAFSNFVQYVDLLYDIRCSGIPSDLVQTIEEIFRKLVVEL